MQKIRQAVPQDMSRIAEIIITNYRINFYPIFRNDSYYFHELQVERMMQEMREDALILKRTYVLAEQDVIKGVLRMDGAEIEKLFVEPAFQSQGVGARLLEYAVSCLGANTLWALEKNTRAIAFYERGGFHLTGQKKPEPDTTEYLVELRR